MKERLTISLRPLNEFGSRNLPASIFQASQSRSCGCGRTQSSPTTFPARHLARCHSTAVPCPRLVTRGTLGSLAARRLPALPRPPFGTAPCHGAVAEGLVCSRPQSLTEFRVGHLLEGQFRSWTEEGGGNPGVTFAIVLCTSTSLAAHARRSVWRFRLTHSLVVWRFKGPHANHSSLHGSHTHRWVQQLGLHEVNPQKLNRPKAKC